MLSKKKPCIFAGLLTAVSVGTALSLSLTPASAMESSSISAVSAGAADSQTLSSQDGPSVSVDELHSPVASNADASVNGANKGQGQVVKGEELAGDQNETGSPSGSNSQNSVETVDVSEKNSNQGAAVNVPQDSGTSNASESSKTSASSEKTFTAGWNQIDGTYYWYENGSTAAKTGWLVTGDSLDGTKGGLQRYWLDASTGALRFNSLISAVDAGWWAYSTDKGYVVRGRYTAADGTVYLADNDGRLEDAGWHVTSDYGQGLQRYFVDSDKHGCVEGYSSDGYAHYTTSDGYVLRGSMKVGDKVYLADNDGRLARSGSSSSGWVVSSAYGQGLQRYWVEGHDGSDGGYARVGFSKDGWAHYTADAGYVIRWKMDMGSLKVLANGDGAIADQAGWLVTSQYDSGVQRYWLEEIPGQAGFFGSKMGLFNVDGKRYYGRPDTGYVVRGVYVISNYYAAPSGDDYDSYHTDTIAVANSDGVLLSRAEVGAMVAAAARTQLGCSYTYVNSGYFPGDSFNCSGLSWWAYNAALGINLSHNQGYWSYYARQDNRNNSQVYGVDKRGGWTTGENNLVPGDLVFFSPVGNKYSTGHVGIYIGDGCMIDSYPGPGVSVRSIYQSGYVGGGCPITVI